jgi:hypothetical protein
MAVWYIRKKSKIQKSVKMESLNSSQALKLLQEYRMHKDRSLLVTREVEGNSFDLGRYPHTRMAYQFMGRNAHVLILRRYNQDGEFILDTGKFYCILAAEEGDYAIMDTHGKTWYSPEEKGHALLMPGKYCIRGEDLEAPWISFYIFRFDEEAVHDWLRDGFFMYMEATKEEAPAENVTFSICRIPEKYRTDPWLFGYNLILYSTRVCIDIALQIFIKTGALKGEPFTNLALGVPYTIPECFEMALWPKLLRRKRISHKEFYEIIAANKYISDHQKTLLKRLQKEAGVGESIV